MNISVNEWEKLKKMSVEKEENKANFFGDEPYVLTEKAKLAGKIINSSSLRISLEEYRNLKEKSQEKTENQFLGNEKYISTPEANYAKYIIDNASIYLTAEEYKQLKLQSEEMEVDEVARDVFGENNEMKPSRNAEEAQTILKKASIKINLQEYEELRNQSEEKETDNNRNLFIEERNSIKPTNNAVIAQEMLEKSIVEVSASEYIKLKEQSQEKEIDEVAKDVFGENNATILSKRAKIAQDILKNITIKMTLEEYEQLKSQTQEREKDENAKEFFGEENSTRLTKRALDAQDILNQNIFIDEEERVFSTDEIGKGTIKEQENTFEKQEEKNSRDKNLEEIENEQKLDDVQK